MQSIFGKARCSKGHPIQNVCVSHTCKASSPFQCHRSTCGCGSVHLRCKSLRVEALEEYLVDWEKWVSKPQQEFISRVNRIFNNLTARVQREQQIFKEFCRDHFLGRDHERVMYILQKHDYGSLSSGLIASAINKVT